MNKIEFFVMALVGLYLCSCGNKQIGKEELCGIWIQPVPRSHIVQGLKLTTTASSFGVHLFSALL